MAFLMNFLRHPLRNLTVGLGVKKQATITAFFKNLCSGVETVPWICPRSVGLCMAEGGTDFGKTPIKPCGA